jgi:hypothetical protein
MKGMADAVSLLVKQPNKPAYEVQLGPQWYVAQMPAKVQVGDNVIVAGSRVQLGGRTVILAQTVTIGKRDIRFRDKKGSPLWITAQVNVTAPVDPSTTGEIVERTTAMIDGIEYNVYRLDTGMGTMDIVGEPSWLSRRQTTTFNVGLNVQVIGLRPPTQIAPGLYLADSFYSGGTLIVLRPPWGY